jgi:DNA repair protein RecO (recombination protein O)
VKARALQRYNRIIVLGPMLKQSEAIVLRSYPLREADLLVTLFTRAEGKVRGVAKAAKKSKRRFGGSLEPLTRVNLYYEDRPRHELARLDACDVIESPLAETVDYPRAVALAHVAELLDELQPDREPNDAIFRLAISVLGRLRTGAIWMPVTYFDLWMVRLIGLLPDLRSCVNCGAILNGAAAYFHPLADGLMCARDKRLASSEITRESRGVAAEIFRSPIEGFSADPWPRARAADLRKFLAQRIERHVEKKLATIGMLEKID